MHGLLLCLIISSINPRERQALALEGCTFHTYLPTYQPKNHTDDSYFCMTKVTSYTRKNIYQRLFINNVIQHSNQFHMTPRMLCHCHLLLLRVIHLMMRMTVMMIWVMTMFIRLTWQMRKNHICYSKLNWITLFETCPKEKSELLASRLKE